MAQVKLGTYEAEEGILPPVCLYCGAPATGFWRRRFAWQPVWTYLLLAVNPLPYLLAALLLRRRRSVLGPFCEKHRRPSRRRLVGVAVAVVLLALALRGLAEVAPSFFLLVWLAGLFWLGLVWLLRVRALYAVSMTEESLTLTGVAEAFADALRREKETALPSRYQPHRAPVNPLAPPPSVSG